MNTYLERDGCLSPFLLYSKDLFLDFIFFVYVALIYHCEMQCVGGNMWRESFYVFFWLKKNQCHQSMSDPKITKQLYVCVCVHTEKKTFGKETDLSFKFPKIYFKWQQGKKYYKSDEKYPSSILSESHLTSGGLSCAI